MASQTSPRTVSSLHEQKTEDSHQENNMASQTAQQAVLPANFVLQKPVVAELAVKQLDRRTDYAQQSGPHELPTSYEESTQDKARSPRAGVERKVVPMSTSKHHSPSMLSSHDSQMQRHIERPAAHPLQQSFGYKPLAIDEYVEANGVLIHNQPDSISSRRKSPNVETTDPSIHF
jgi:hypothetical protein